MDLSATQNHRQEALTGNSLLQESEESDYAAQARENPLSKNVIQGVFPIPGF
jgi:hypothetical protein